AAGMVNEKRRTRTGSPLFLLVVGAAGFEPATPSSRTMYATRLRYAPTQVDILSRPGASGQGESVSGEAAAASFPNSKPSTASATTGGGKPRRARNAHARARSRRASSDRRKRHAFRSSRSRAVP